ncbi:photoreceptor cilium actin regulator-like [Engraulis encrasicolus]|uniref:photoreceptor cilium actin regulator-like n=1 Tax=Engraulis encrasicolus TaxID=184585 RepID=UPI002FD5FDAA
MGCTPSKGRLFALAFSSEKTIEDPPQNSDNACIVSVSTDPPVLEKAATDCCSEKDVKENSTVSKEKTPSVTEVISDAATINEDTVQKIEVNVAVQEKLPPVDQKPDSKPPRVRGEKRKKTKDGKKSRSKDKLKKGSLIHTKIELPEEMVKAHQAAYSYLNPNISKYETLLRLLDQASHTQLSLQPMVTMVATRYDEINLTLEEMAREGEQMLKEHGEHMAWPAGLPRHGPLASALKQSQDDQNCPRPPPPDLLQQLLQHSTEKMRLVGESVTSLGDSALEEATEYFASISELLGEKLKTKRAVEGRLKQVLTRVEAAAVSKLGMEDSALHSEDSGIGGENESLAGSDRHRQHRESCQSSAAPNVLNGTLLLYGEDGEDEDDEEGDDDEDDEEEEVEDEERVKPSVEPTANRSLKTPTQSPRKEKKCARRPKTADPTKTPSRPDNLRGSRRSRSLVNLHQDSSSLDEPTGSSLTLGQEKARRDMETSEGARPKLRRHSSIEASLETRRNPCPPTPAAEPQGRHAVKRLITTFSHGQYGRHDDMDVDSLPPPPPEILMDNSFEITRGAAAVGEGGGQNGPTLSRSGTCQQNNNVSQKLRASVQSMSVLPNRANVQHSSLSLSAACAAKSEGVDDDMDTANAVPETHYRHSHKITHSHDPATSRVKVGQEVVWSPAATPAGIGSRQASHDHGDSDTLSPPLPPVSWPSSTTTPPVARPRLPPACPPLGHHVPTPPSFPSGRRTSSNSEENLPVASSAAFASARSVFCQEQASRTLSTTSTLPRPWGESSRGRLPHTVPQGFARRSSSEQRAPTCNQTEPSPHPDQAVPSATHE